MIAIGNDEIEKAKKLGDFVLCKRCGKRHKVEYGEERINGTFQKSNLFAFCTCNGERYLVGIKGKEIQCDQHGIFEAFRKNNEDEQ